MALASGTKLGSYEIRSALGAGGMGEVYRATDSKLKRDVALKVLPEAFASDAQRMARFEREAQFLASLNHPSIAAIYGLEESDGTRALVMELVDGPTIADRLKQGAIPLDEALPIAKQIAEALEYAHDHGIIHRDLKPANIKIKSDGTVKVLDFGLAKALADDPATQDIATSPTLSVAATKAGFIIGTAAYMAPEQARGRSVDRRADIWSFGTVLYEMLTGKLAFHGETISDTLAAVIRAEPEWNALPANLSVTIRQLLQRCLRKDPKSRLQSIGDARITIDEFLASPAGISSPESPAPAVVAAQPSWRRAIPWFGTALLALIAVGAIWRPWQAAPNPGVIRLTADFGGEGSLYSDYGTAVLLSPDGTRIVYVEKDARGKRQLFVRSLDQMQGAPLVGTEGARNPFFSPDGQWLGFFTSDKLKKISLQGGATVTLCDIQDDRGGAWGEDGSIVFASHTRMGLSKVSASGGTPVEFSKLDTGAGELTHRWPQFLPGGKAILFTSSTDGNNYNDSDISVQVIATGRRKNLFHGGYYPRYLSSGHVVFIHEGTLFAAPFDLKRLEFTGEPVPVFDQVVGNLSNAGGQFSASQGGLFTYLSGKGARERMEVDWLTADGKLTPLRKEPAAYWGVSFSPDGKFLALGLEDGKRQDIWVDDWQRDTTRRLTFTGAENFYPAWTPDGKHISYAATGEGGNFSISWRRADGVGDAQPLVEGKLRYGPMSWRPDGKVLAFSQRNKNNEWNIMTVTFQGDEKNGLKAGEPKPFLDSASMGLTPAFSPDGRWLAYTSNESGVIQLYVRPFPGPGGKWQISTQGGVFPEWSADGREIFFRTDNDKLMVASYSVSGDSFRADTPRPWTDITLADRGPNPNFALHPDGKRMAIFKDPSADPLNQLTKVTFVFNFLEEVRRKLAPAKP